jgi:hypothetical protein
MAAATKVSGSDEAREALAAGGKKYKIAGKWLLLLK